MRAKYWLNRYRKCILKIRAFELQIEELETMAAGGAINIKPTPSGKNNNFDPVQEAGVRVADLITKIESVKREAEMLIVDIVATINQLDDEYEQLVLTCRYVKCMRWPDVIKEIGYSESKVHEIHENALKNIKISEFPE